MDPMALLRESPDPRPNTALSQSQVQEGRCRRMRRRGRKAELWLRARGGCSFESELLQGFEERDAVPDHVSQGSGLRRILEFLELFLQGLELSEGSRGLEQRRSLREFLVRDQVSRRNDPPEEFAVDLRVREVMGHRMDVL